MRLWPCCTIGGCGAFPYKPGSGSFNGKTVVQADHQTPKKWYLSAIAVGSLVLVMGGVLGVLGLLQVHGVTSFPQGLTSVIGTIGHTPHAWSLWTMAIGGNIVGLVSIAWGANGLYSIRMAEKQQTLMRDNKEPVSDASSTKPAPALPTPGNSGASVNQQSAQDYLAQQFQTAQDLIFQQLQVFGFSEDSSVLPKALPDTKLQLLLLGHYYVVRPKSDQNAQGDFWIVLKTQAGKTFWHAPLDEGGFWDCQIAIQQLGFRYQSWMQQPPKNNFDLKIARHFGENFDAVGCSKELLKNHPLQKKNYVYFKIPKKTDQPALWQSQRYYIVIKTAQGQVLCTEAIDEIFLRILQGDLDDNGYQELQLPTS